MNRSSQLRAAALRFDRFEPGLHLIPDSDLLFIGAGTTLLAYELASAGRLWEDVPSAGFSGWQQFGEVVLMSAELELAAWDLKGQKLWSEFVEPPWDYEVHGEFLDLDVMGKKRRRRLK